MGVSRGDRGRALGSEGAGDGASLHPGGERASRLAPPGADRAGSASEWEFGALHALGPCVLSVSEKRGQRWSTRAGAAVLASVPPRRRRATSEETGKTLAREGGGRGGADAAAGDARRARVRARRGRRRVVPPRAGRPRPARGARPPPSGWIPYCTQRFWPLATTETAVEPRADGSGADSWNASRRRVRPVDRQSRPSRELPAAAGDAAADVYTSAASPPPSSCRLPRGSGAPAKLADDVSSGDDRGRAPSAPGPRRARRHCRRPRPGSSRARVGVNRATSQFVDVPTPCARAADLRRRRRSR